MLAQLRRIAEDLLQADERLVDAPEERHGILGRHRHAAALAEQRKAGGALQVADRAADRRLRDVDGARRGADSAVQHDGAEDLEHAVRRRAPLRGAMHIISG
jgi:hypothetical protein